ncbi:MAG: GAF domain-containing protein [Pseudomonadota bacterium]
MTRTLATALSDARDAGAVFAALHAHSQAFHPVRLWTVMSVDMEAGIARRAYTSHPEAYPVSGTKPVPEGDWFDGIHRGEIFVANTLADIAEVFPDHEAIGALGCGAVVNLPVMIGGTLAATINLLDAEHAFPPAVVARLDDALALPALAAVAVGRLV